jgi:hypothetical protein
VTQSIGSPVGALGAVTVVALLEEHGEVERTVRVAALGRPSIRALGAGDVVPTFQQDAEVAGGCGMAGRVSAPVRRFGFGAIAAMLQLQAQTKLTLGERAAVVHGPISANSNPAHALQKFF